MYLKLGTGLPLAAPPSESSGIILPSENGFLGLGRNPKLGKEDADLIDSGKENVALRFETPVFGQSRKLWCDPRRSHSYQYARRFAGKSVRR